MKMNESLEQRFNDQITLEFAASIVYRQLAIEMDDKDLPGIATWFRLQADEEITHAGKFIDHLSDRGNRAQIGDIPAPDLTASTVEDCFAGALSHERRVSESIRELYRAAEKEDDLDSRPLLNWFLQEQVEEEATVEEILGRVKLIAGDGPGLLRLDEELAGRSTPSDGATA